MAKAASKTKRQPAKKAKAKPASKAAAQPAKKTKAKPAKKAAAQPAKKAKAQPSAAKSRRTKSAPRPMASRSRPKGNKVAVLGGGISGMTSALKLSRAGFDVTIFELHERLGGNTSSREINGTEHDVYPHMFCSWYTNFWDLYKNDLNGDIETNFEPRAGSKLLEKGDKEFKTLLAATSIEAAIENLKSGVLGPAEMWLLGYSALDLAAHPFDRSGINLMEMLSVNGFIFSRGYGTEDVAAMQNYLLTLIWSIPSAWTAAGTYQNFLRHSFSFPNHAPFNYLLKSSLEEGLNEPFKQALDDAGCTTRLKTEVTAVRIGDGERPEVFFRKSLSSHLEHDSDRIDLNENPIESDVFDYAVMALPVMKACDIVLGEARGRQGERIVDRVPQLAEMQKLSAVSIPVVDLYLNRKLEDMPSDHIALAGSKFGLTVLDISQLWEGHDFDGKTAIVLAASEGAAIPSVELVRQGELMLQEFAEFFPDFNPGTEWGDENSDVDWHKSWIRSNRHYQLFLNDTGSWAHRPKIMYEAELPRVAFAGDCARTDVDMATVEGAVEAGTAAACAIQAQDAVLNGHGRRGSPIELSPHRVYSTATFRFANLFYLPMTYAAYARAAFEQWKKRLEDDDHTVGANEFTMAEYTLLIPLQFTIDWWKAAYWFGRSLISDDNNDPLGGRITYLPNPANLKADLPGIQSEEMVNKKYDPDHTIGLPEAILAVMREVVEYASGREAPHRSPSRTPQNANDKPKREPFEDIVDLAVSAIDTGLRLGEQLATDFSKRRAEGDKEYKRHWRTKR